MIYFTSDLHFSHENIIKYCQETRPFKTVKEMNEVLIKNWNDTVTAEDTVYVLGDFFMGHISNIDAILPQLNGKIILIRGNHDSKDRIRKMKQLGVEVKDIDYLRYKGRFFILCHFPIASQEFIDMVRNDNSEVIALYGHVHQHAPKGYVDGTYHVGVDTNDLKPVSIKQIWDESWPAKMTPDVQEYKNKHEKD